MKEFWKGLGIFVGLGPLVSWAVFLIIMIASSRSLASLGALSNILKLLVWSYIIGTAPSIIIGFCAVAFTTHLHRWYSAILCGVVGMATAYPVSLLLLDHKADLWMRIVCSLPGAAAGFICSLIYSWPRKISNNQTDNTLEGEL